jgi:hypothetical protein
MSNRLQRGGLLFALVLVGASAEAQDVADAIYSGGPILTIDDKQPVVEAVAVRDGCTLAVGKTDAVLAYRGESTGCR